MKLLSETGLPSPPLAELRSSRRAIGGLCISEQDGMRLSFRVPATRQRSQSTPPNLGGRGERRPAASRIARAGKRDGPALLDRATAGERGHRATHETRYG